jgi:hypothetical protein
MKAYRIGLIAKNINSRDDRLMISRCVVALLKLAFEKYIVTVLVVPASLDG